MKFREPVEFKDIIAIVKKKLDKDVSYCIYSKLTSSYDLRLDTICYIDDYPEITDDDEEIFSEFVKGNSLSLLFREELVQDVIYNMLHQNQSATDQEILNATSYYSNHDNFMILNKV